MLTAICVLKEGGEYTRWHVDRLAGQISGHLTPPYRFVCLDDSPFPGWWSKVSLFEPGRFSGRVLYLDLDVTVVGSLDDLAAYPYPFCAISDYLNPPKINSSVMAWDAGVADHLFNEFSPDVTKRLHGDQDWIHERQPNMTRFPKRWCPSYKAHVLPAGGAPQDARVIVFHGKPRPWGVPHAG